MSSNSALPFLRLAGSPRAVGEAHGRLAASLVAHNLAVYFRRFAEEAQLPRHEVMRRSLRYWEILRDHNQEFTVMVEGIAAGAHQPLMEIVALTLRYEFLYGEYSRIGREELGGPPSPGGECTAFAVLPDASRDGHLRAGQNWDWIPEAAGLLLHITRPDGLRVLCLSEAGVAGGKIGMNSAGVGLVINGLLSDADDWSRMGRPFHLRTWEALCSQDLEESAAAVTAAPRACSANFLVAHAGGPGRGRAFNLETAPGGVCRLEPSNGLLAHANHFRDPDRMGIWQPIVEEKRSTYHRCARIEHLLAEKAAAGGIDEDALKTILQDHLEYPESVCRHPNPSHPKGERYQTVASVIMDLHAGRMQVAPGPPCESAYLEFRI